MNIADVKELPSNILAERALIASVVDDNDILYEIDIDHTMFRGYEEREIYKVIQEIAKETKNIDVSIVYGKLKEEIKNHYYDIMLCDHLPTRRKQYEMEIKEKHYQRKIIKAGGDIAVLGLEYANIDKIKSILSSILMENIITPPKTFLQTFQETLDSLGQRKDVICKFGYKSLDNLKGYAEGNLIVIGARPKIGKSAFALNLMKRIAQNQIKTALFSLEMNQTEIAERFISILTNTSSYRLDHLSDTEKTEVIHKANDNLLLLSYIEVIDNVSDANKIYSYIRRLSAEGHKVIFIDYLQLVKGEGQNKNEVIGNITTSLKRLASELSICVVVLSQLNRDGAKGKPELHNLRDSGSIEQDANMVWFLNYNLDVPRVLSVDIAANRSGPTVEIDLSYIKEFYIIND